MSSEALDYLERPALRRLMFAARERFERNGGPFGKLSLTALTPEEALALNGLLEPGSPYLPGREAMIKLPRLDAKLRDSRLGVSLEEALVAVDGPLANARAERAAATAAREVAWARVLAHPVAARPELAPWLDHARRRWTGASGERTATVLQALDVLAALPADGIPLAALAASTRGRRRACTRPRSAARALRRGGRARARGCAAARAGDGRRVARGVGAGRG